jgi:hypothetical protein
MLGSELQHAQHEKGPFLAGQIHFSSLFSNWWER